MACPIEKISGTSVLIAISVFWIAAALFQKNSNFLDVRGVFKMHLKLFSGSPLQFGALFIAPLLLSIAIASEKVLSKDIINNLNIVLSIFMSMFFAMLSILPSLSDKDVSEENNDITSIKLVNKYNALLKETFNAILFESIVAVVVLAISFSLLFRDNFNHSWQLILVSGIVYYLSLVVVFNIFVIIKRIKVLFEEKARQR